MLPDGGRAEALRSGGGLAPYLLEEGQMVTRMAQKFIAQLGVKHHEVINVHLDEVLLQADSRAQEIAVNVVVLKAKVAEKVAAKAASSARKDEEDEEEDYSGMSLFERLQVRPFSCLSS